MGWGVWVQLLEGQDARARVIFVLCEGIWNAPAVLLLLPAFDDTGSLGQVVYPPGSMVPPWMTASRFLSGNSEAELQPSAFSSLS